MGRVAIGEDADADNAGGGFVKQSDIIVFEIDDLCLPLSLLFCPAIQDNKVHRFSRLGNRRIHWQC